MSDVTQAERGVLRTGWQPEDEAAFQALVDKLIAQYAAYEATPGTKSST